MVEGAVVDVVGVAIATAAVMVVVMVVVVGGEAVVVDADVDVAVDATGKIVTTLRMVAMRTRARRGKGQWNPMVGQMLV